MPKLTKAEKAWIAEVQEVLDRCPSKRMGFYTIGDDELFVYDYSKEKKIGEFQDRGADMSDAVSKANASFDVFLNFPNNVHSVAG